jgi:hypothetical protein
LVLTIIVGIVLVGVVGVIAVFTVGVVGVFTDGVVGVFTVGVVGVFTDGVVGVFTVDIVGVFTVGLTTAAASAAIAVSTDPTTPASLLSRTGPTISPRFGKVRVPPSTAKLLPRCSDGNRGASRMIGTMPTHDGNMSSSSSISRLWCLAASLAMSSSSST